MDDYQLAAFRWHLFKEKIAEWFGQSVVLSCPVPLAFFPKEKIEFKDPDEAQGKLLQTEKGQIGLLNDNQWVAQCETREYELYIILDLFKCAEKGSLSAEAIKKARWLAANTSDEEVLSLLNDLFLNRPSGAISF